MPLSRAETSVVGGSRRRTWLITAGALAALLSLFANGSSAAKSQTAPVNTAMPTISGTPVVGATADRSAGTWTGTGIRYSYQWLRCDSAGTSCAPMQWRHQSSRRPLAAADLGSTLRFSVVAASRRGSTSATSDATSVVTQPPTGSTGPSAPTGLSATSPTTSSVTLTWNASTGSRSRRWLRRLREPDTRRDHDGNLIDRGQPHLWQELHVRRGRLRRCRQQVRAGLDQRRRRDACPSSSQIYWGAWIEGKQTYSYLYGGTWGNAPWNSQTWTRYDQNVGKNPSIIHWGAGTFWDHNFSYWASTLRLRPERRCAQPDRHGHRLCVAPLDRVRV